MPSDSRATTVVEVISLLETIQRDGLSPSEALGLVTNLRAGQAMPRIELVWEQEAYDASVHYDALVREADGTTLSISLCRGGSLPWPLRGVHRWSEANLVQVNGRMVTMEAAVHHLDLVWDESPIMKRLVDMCLVQDELARQPVEISDEELQRGVDGLRQAHRLLSPQDMERWMEQRGVSHAWVEQLVAGQLALSKVRDRVLAATAADFIESQGDALDAVYLAVLEVSDERALVSVREDLDRGTSFEEAARRLVVDSGNPARYRMEALRRRDATHALGRAAFDGRTGDVIGPVRHGKDLVLAQVIGQRGSEADLDDADLASLVFEAWLESRRAEARVTWHWGRERRDGASG